MGELVLNINGKAYKVNAPEEETLLSVLRNRINLTGTKYGCGEGQCGACTVLMDGAPTRSCSIPAAAAAGTKITTIEGLEVNGRLTAVQQAFLDEGAFQCGYCTSGMIMSATALLRDSKAPNDEQILGAMNGNVCRCGTYPRILEAIKRASGLRTSGGGR
ncbi:MAG TPA: (2Fe-2S)-binding protein [Candidatus Binatus sp.]|nr:(2Fe-2S)-binding protein [Candidatus Binatus sp.]